MIAGIQAALCIPAILCANNMVRQEHATDLMGVASEAATARQVVGGGLLVAGDRLMARLGRNEPCHCGSARKYKNCCLSKDDEEARAADAAARAERQEAATEQEPAEGDVAEAESRPAPERRSPSEGKSRFWGHDDRSGRGGRFAGRSRGSGHR